MKRKKILSLILLSCLMVLCCLFGVFGWNIGETRTASADTTPRYTVQFTYTNNKIVSNLGNNSTTKYRSGTNVTSASVLDNDGSNIEYGHSRAFARKKVRESFQLIFHLYLLLKRDYAVLFAILRPMKQIVNLNVYQ